jgi:Tfp pilus assembly protein PilV
VAALNRNARGGAGESGAGLVEVLVAMIILGIAALALSGATLQILARHTDAALRSEASIIARTYMEDVRTRSVSSLTSEDSLRVDELGHADPNGHYVRRLTVVSGPVPKSRLITVQVSYDRGSAGTGMVEIVTIAYESFEG